MAAWSVAKQGAEVVLLHMDARPYSDDIELEKVMQLRERLEVVCGRKMPLFVAPHYTSLESLSSACEKPYICVLCKRTMLHAAKNLALKLGAESVVTGESLGQVASQTLYNLRAESFGLRFPILRPLIGLDKIEIENMAKQIGTYEISVKKPSICRMVPKHPVTMCKLQDLAAQEERVDIIQLAKRSADLAQEISRPHSPSS